MSDNSHETVLPNAVSKSDIDQSNEVSQTASEYIDSQLQLEAEAREALPYSFDHCTRPLGALKQNIYSCITCNPPSANPTQPYKAAGICYGCSISCHGEHTLVELFAHRDFTCDCGTTRIPPESPCTLRINPTSGIKEPVHSEEASPSNTYNHNFKNIFCGCGELYDAHQQKGTMYQCIGLATEQNGGCGEDWWHPECLLGLSRDWYLSSVEHMIKKPSDADEEQEHKDEHPVPPGFSEEFESLICYKCVSANPWIKKYAGSEAFTSLPFTPEAETAAVKVEEANDKVTAISSEAITLTNEHLLEPNCKRKAEDDTSDSGSVTSKRTKVEDEEGQAEVPKHLKLKSAPSGIFSLLAMDEDFRSKFCRCPACYADLSRHPQLLEEEETYEPPVSEDGEDEIPGSVGTGSLLERGEAALSNVDRVRAIEGVMVYNNLRDKVKSFLKPFAESGEAVSAEDIKTYFEKLRGDDQAMRDAANAAPSGNVDNRREQSG